MFSSELKYRTVEFDEDAWRRRRHILHVDASHGPASLVAQGAQAFLAGVAEACPLSVERLGLWDDEAARSTEYGLRHVSAKLAMLSGGEDAEDAESFAGIEQLASQAASARALVVSAPLWNYGPPHALKRYFDCVLHPGLTFTETPDGPQGLLGGGRPLVIVTSAGGAGAKDHLTPWLVDVAAMMGFDQPTIVSVTNANHAERQQLLEAVTRDAEAAARRVGPRLLAALSAPPGMPDDSGNAGGAQADVEMVDPAWDHGEVFKWLKDRGGISEDGLEAIQAAKVNGELWRVATQEDWRSEELGLEEADIKRLVALQGRG